MWTSAACLSHYLFASFFLAYISLPPFVTRPPFLIVVVWCDATAEILRPTEWETLFSTTLKKKLAYTCTKYYITSRCQAWPMIVENAFSCPLKQSNAPLVFCANLKPQPCAGNWWLTKRGRVFNCFFKNIIYVSWDSLGCLHLPPTICTEWTRCAENLKNKKEFSGWELLSFKLYQYLDTIKDIRRLWTHF